MGKLKAMNVAVHRYFSRFSRKQFFAAFVVTTAVNYWLANHVDDYQSIWLASLGGWFFGMMFVDESYKKTDVD